MGSMSILHWLIVLAVVVLIFGTAKLKNLGKDLGMAVKGFKEGLKDESTKARAQAPAQLEERCHARDEQADPIDVELKEKA